MAVKEFGNLTWDNKLIQAICSLGMCHSLCLDVLVRYSCSRLHVHVAYSTSLLAASPFDVQAYQHGQSFISTEAVVLKGQSPGKFSNTAFHNFVLDCLFKPISVATHTVTLNTKGKDVSPIVVSGHTKGLKMMNKVPDLTDPQLRAKFVKSLASKLASMKKDATSPTPMSVYKWDSYCPTMKADQQLRSGIAGTHSTNADYDFSVFLRRIKEAEDSVKVRACL